MTNRLKYFLSYIPAWGFFWLGDTIGKLISYNMEYLFPIYKSSMNMSLFFSDWGNIGVWLDE